MNGAPGAGTLFISSLTRNRGNVTRWLYLWALMQSWLVAVDRVGRHAGSWSYIQRSIRNHENEGKSNNLGWMLYTLYAVLGVCSTWCHLMIMTWRDREEGNKFVFCDDGGVVHGKERDGGCRSERCGGYEQIWEIRGMTCLIGLGRPRIDLITHRIGISTCRIGDGTSTHTRNSLKCQFLMMISNLLSSLSFSSSTLPSPTNMKLSHRSLSLHAIIKS